MLLHLQWRKYLNQLHYLASRFVVQTTTCQRQKLNARVASQTCQILRVKLESNNQAGTAQKFMRLFQYFNYGKTFN